jgi:superfamily II DNA/RNA helicase
MMQDFKNGETSVMIATPNSVRGLDFPDLSHVYTLYLPNDDPREYVHLAGRVGRVGQMGSVKGDGGHVVSILSEEDADKMADLAEELQFEFVDVEPLSEEFSRLSDEALDDIEKEDVEEARRILEDTMTLIDLADDVGAEHDRLASNEAQNVNDDVVVDVAAVDDDDEEEGAFQ